MMLRTIALFAALTLLAGTSSSLSGSVYRGGSGTTSSAVPGALVYVHAASSNADWIGPAVTDTFGRYTFDAVSSGSYSLRIFINGKRVWEQTVVGPGRIAPIVLPSGGS
jgi:hypothetical protein